MEKIIFINGKHDSIEIEKGLPFLLTKISGTESPEVDIKTSQSPYQDGSTVNSVMLKERTISINGTIIADSNKDLFSKREYLCRIFNPKLKSGQLIYINDNGEKRINCYPEKSPSFGDKQSVTQEFLISLFCPNPFWLDKSCTFEQIATWIGGAKFPCEFPISFAKKGSTVKNINISGDVETPAVITFKGPATNPCVTNLSTGEFIKINKNLTADDTLVINTEFGNKKVYIEDKSGNKVNVFNWIDLGSTFFQLKTGDNVIQYSSDNGVEPASVLVEYSNRYIGI